MDDISQRAAHVQKMIIKAQENLRLAEEEVKSAESWRALCRTKLQEAKDEVHWLSFEIESGGIRRGDKIKLRRPMGTITGGVVDDIYVRNGGLEVSLKELGSYLNDPSGPASSGPTFSSDQIYKDQE